ncbi:MAG: hypothetical protein OEM01_05920 [Desulfobulbaceae bacterium]|nr:hypothetical protein [Desulfobulbaceae bacterium]
MKTPGKRFVSKQVITYEILSFLIIIVVIWLDEILDMPHFLFGAAQTPINWIESLFESVIIAVVGVIIISITSKLFEKMKYLEGILPVCASCKKIRDDKGSWHSIENYVRERSEAEFSHGICPECAEKLYPEFNPYNKDE